MSYEERLKGGHPNSLGNTVEIVEEVLQDHSKFPELLECWFSDDELVRLRVSNGIKRVFKKAPDLLYPYVDTFLNEIAQIDQPSTQWSIAQLYDYLKNQMDEKQLDQAVSIMKHNLANHNDWIVLNTTMQILSDWSKSDIELKKWIEPHLQRLAADSRKSVASRAKKLLASRH